MYNDDFRTVDLQGLSQCLDQFIVDYCIERCIDLLEIPPALWNHILLSIHDKYFNDKRLLTYINDLREYDIEKVNIVYDIYIRLCFKYKSIVSISGFSYMTGIQENTIYSWDVGGSRARIALAAKIKNDNEKSLEARLMDKGTKNPMSVLPVLNRYHGWNQREVLGDKQEVKQLGASDLQQLQLGEKREKIIDVDLLPPLEQKQGG